MARYNGRRRPTLIRTPGRGQLRDNTITRARTQAKAKEERQRAISKFITKFTTNIKNVLGSTNTINEAKQRGVKYINSIHVNTDLKNRISNIYKRELQILKNQQTSLINSVKARIRASLHRIERYEDKNLKAKEDVEFAKKDAYQEALQRLQKGERLSYGTIEKFVGAKGRREQARLTSEKQAKAQRQQTANVEIFVREQIKVGKTPNIKNIRDKFGLSLKEAHNIHKVIRKSNIAKQKILFYIEDPILKRTRLATPKEILDLRNKNISDISKELRVTRSEAIKIEKQIEPSNAFKLNPKTGKPFGYITKAEAPKTWAEHIEKYRQRIIYKREKAQYGKVMPMKIIGSQMLLGGVGIVRGLNSVKDAITHPWKTIKSQIHAITHPVQTIRVLSQEFIVDPVGTIAQYYTFSKALNLGTKGLKRTPVGRFVQEELFIKAQPKEVQPFIRSIFKSSKVQERINPHKLKNIKKVDFMEIQTLTKAEGVALAKTLQQTDTVVFGSVASRTLSKKQTPIPHDIDLATANIQTFSKKFINNLPQKIRKSYTLKGEKLYRHKSNNALFDIKPIKRIYPDKSLFSKKGFLPVSGFVYDITGKLIKKLGIKQKIKVKTGTIEVPTQKIVKVKGIKLVGFGEQTTRKGLGTIQVILEKNVRRAKDPSAFIKSLEVQVRGLKIIKPKTKLGKIVNTRKIKKLNNALKILKSKSFARLLEKKVPGLLKEYPIFKKVNVKKLKQSIKKPKKLVPRRKPIIKPKKKTIAEKKAKIITDKRTIKKAKASFSRLPKTLKHSVYSYLPKALKSRLKSLLPSRIPSKVPSKIPSKPPSKIPSKPPSKLPSKPPSKLPSKLPSKPPSKLPSKLPSKIPSKLPSKPPSKIPSKLPSKPPSKLPSKLPSKPPSKLPSKPPLIPRFKLTWDSKPPKRFVFLVNGIIRVKGKRRLIRLNTTPNRALSKMAKLVDHTTARSFELIIIGKKIGKDISTPTIMKKFRPKKSRGSRVLKLVEKTKYAIDTWGEKQGLASAKVLKKRHRKKKHKTIKRKTRHKSKKRKKK